MSATQDYLRTPGNSLDSLSQEFGIRITRDDGRGLVILNYDQIESRPKTHPVVRDCRALVLEVDTWRAVGRGFQRFFNLGECPEEDARFDWTRVYCQEKCDGSLALLFRHKGELVVTTRGSFAGGRPNPDVATTWQELFWSSGINREKAEAILTEGLTLVFELCSPLNKVVRLYREPTLFLLDAFWSEGDGRKDALGPVWCDWLANRLGVKRPTTYKVRGPGDLDDLLQAGVEPTFEGFVATDSNRLKVKVKNPKYIALHHLKGEGNNLFSPKYLVPFVLGTPEERDELLVYFPECHPAFERVCRTAEQFKNEMFETWEVAKDSPTQKEFAIKVAGRPTSSILFDARKRGVDPSEVWKEQAEDLLVKHLKGSAK